METYCQQKQNIKKKEEELSITSFAFGLNCLKPTQTGFLIIFTPLPNNSREAVSAGKRSNSWLKLMCGPLLLALVKNWNESKKRS